MPDRDVAAQAVQLLLVEDLRDEAEVAQRGQAALLRDGDARGLLAAVLQREEPEVREPRDVAVGRVHAEDAAHLAHPPDLDEAPRPEPRDLVAGGVARIAAPCVGSAGSSTSASRPLQRAASASACSRPP